MPDFTVVYLDPNHLYDTGEGESTQPPVDKKFLATGDSWFSIGSLPAVTTNIINELQLSYSFGIVSRTQPGQELRLMVDSMQDKVFNGLLAGTTAFSFDAILVSAGGNDLIVAAEAPPSNDTSQQILLTAAQRNGTQVPIAQYISPDGWNALAMHLRHWFREFVDRRDSAADNRRTPLFFHNYAYCMPRPAAALPGIGPWLNRAMDTYAVPQSDRLALSNAMMDKLSDVLQAVVQDCAASDPNCNVFLIDTRTKANLTLAAEGSGGESGDWINEIHPNRAGYKKLAAVWRQQIEASVKD